MKAIVCVKQVPDTSGKVAVNPDGTLNRASMATIINPDDKNAVEAALKLKDATGCKVVVITMGPPPAQGMLRELMAMGADEGILVSAREFGGSDTFATSQILAAAIKKYGVDADEHNDSTADRDARVLIRQKILEQMADFMEDDAHERTQSGADRAERH